MKEIIPHNHLPNNAYACPGMWSGTMTRKQLKETLLATDGWVLACGYVRNIVSKHIGTGVYRISLKINDND